MNVHQLQRAALRPGLSPMARLVFLTLTTYASGDGPRWAIWPGNEALLHLTGVSAPTLARSLRELEAAGWISRSSKGALRRTLHLHPPLTDHADPSVGSCRVITQTMQDDPTDQDHTSTDHQSLIPQIMQTPLRDHADPSDGSGSMISQRGRNVPYASSALNTGSTVREDLRVAKTPSAPNPKRGRRSEPRAEQPAVDGAPPLRAQAGAGAAGSDLSPLSGGDDVAAAWARAGGAGPVPAAVVALEADMGRAAALTALDALRERVEAGGVRAPARLVALLAQDVRTGRRPVVGVGPGEAPAYEAPVGEEAARALRAQMEAARAVVLGRSRGGEEVGR